MSDGGNLPMKPTPLCEIRGCFEVIGGCAVREVGLCSGCPADHLCLKHYFGLMVLLDRKRKIHWPSRADRDFQAPPLNEADTAKVRTWAKEWNAQLAVAPAARGKRAAARKRRR